MVFLLKAEAACFVLAPGNPIDLSKYSLEGIFRQVNILPGCLVGLPALDGKTNKNATCPEAGYIHRGVPAEVAPISLLLRTCPTA